MIEFVFGREPHSKTEYVTKCMKKSLSEGKKCILIIPEQQALFWDNLVAEQFEKSDALKIEALSFKRLANSVFRKFGGIAKSYATEAESSLVMWNAIVSVSDKLRAFKSIDREDRYVSLMLFTCREMKLYGITPDDLLSAADNMDGEHSSLPDRLHDLALISAAYDTILREMKDDPEEILDALESTLAENDYFGGSSVFLDSFYTLTPKEIKVVEQVIRQAEDVTVTFAMSINDTNVDYMEYVSDYMRKMARAVNRAGLDIKKTQLPDNRKEEFAYLSENLWNYGAVPFEKETEAVETVKCSDRYDEAVLVGAKIKKLVAEGASFSDIAVVCANFESLRGITDVELERQGIPVYVSGKTPVTSQPALRLLLYASYLCANGWRRGDIISCARTGLCGLSLNETDALEMYTDKWRINGKKRYCAEQWSMNADGYSDTESKWGRELLRLANEAKDKLVSPLEAFSESFPGKICDVCAAAFKLLMDFDVYSRLKEETTLLEKAGKYADAQVKSQVWGALCTVLDTLARCTPDATVDARRFAALLRRTAETCMIGSIPDGIDRVSLGTVGSVRTDSIKHIIILGAKSGEFPRVPTENGFFSDSDREMLKAQGIEISPNVAYKQREELFRFCETVSAPRESLTVFIPSDSSGNHASLGAIRLMKLMPGAKVRDFTTSEGESIIRKRGKTGEEYTTGDLSADGDRTTGSALMKLFDKDISLTQTRIECFNSCAFKYYCEHILRLDDSAAAELKPAQVGTFVHSILENFMKEASKEAAFPMENEAVISRSERLIREYKEKVAPESTGGYVSYMFDRIAKSINLFAKALNREFSQSKFVPHSFELPVGFSDELPAVPIRLKNGHDLTVRGIVDRMDVMHDGDKVYVRVVDYKTGSKTFSLTKVLRGENIQLLLYLFALCNMPKSCSFAKELAPNGEDILPAGAVYFSAKPGDIASGDLIGGKEAEEFALDSISRTGIVLGSSEVIQAMDSEMNGKYAPAYLDKKGNLKGSFVESAEDFNDIKSSIDEFLKYTGDNLTTGYAASIPTGFGEYSACEYCAMLPVCRHGTGSGENEAERRDENE